MKPLALTEKSPTALPGHFENRSLLTIVFSLTSPIYVYIPASGLNIHILYMRVQTNAESLTPRGSPSSSFSSRRSLVP